MNTKVEAKAEKEYHVDLCEMDMFFKPHKDSNHLNAQDVVHTLVEQAKNLASIGVCQYSGDLKNNECNLNHDAMMGLFWDIQCKLKMIDKILPKAFKYDEHSVID